MQYNAKASKYLLELLRSILNGTIPNEKPADVSWNAIYTMAKNHSVTALTFCAIQKLKSLPEEALFQRWKKDNNKLLVKGSNQENELAILSDCFEKNSIPYMPLKGSIIRKLFPQPYLREMSDLDILIPDEKLQQASELCATMGYQVGPRVDHHMELSKPPYMNIELHTDLIASFHEQYKYYKNPWARTCQCDNSTRHVMKNEDFYLYFLTHAAKHYYNFGTGIRTVIDVYIYNQTYRASMDTKYISQELKKLNLVHFAHQIECLAEYWFSETPVNISDDAKEMQTYILSSTTYGNRSNYDINQVRKYMEKGKSEKKAKMTMFWHMTFLPRGEMIPMFPVLKKVPALLPFCWIARWFRIIFTKPKSITNSYKRVQSVELYNERENPNSSTRIIFKKGN